MNSLHHRHQHSTSSHQGQAHGTLHRARGSSTCRPRHRPSSTRRESYGSASGVTSLPIPIRPSSGRVSHYNIPGNLPIACAIKLTKLALRHSSTNPTRPTPYAPTITTTSRHPRPQHLSQPLPLDTPPPTFRLRPRGLQGRLVDIPHSLEPGSDHRQREA